METKKENQTNDDLKEFEELWNNTDEEEFSHNSYEYLMGRYYFLTSRRLLREKKTEDHYDKFWTCNPQSGDGMGGEVISLKEEE